MTSEHSAMSSAHGSFFSIFRSPALATSDMSLKTVQVASILDVCLGKNALHAQLLSGESV